MKTHHAPRSLPGILVRFLLSCALLAAPDTGGAQDPYSLKVDVSLVSVDVTATDARGNILDTLTKDDFLVFEDGAPQEIAFFSPVSAPYNVFLLFDISGSTETNRDFMRQAVEGLVGSLRPQDSIAMASFNHEFQLVLPWTKDGLKARAAMTELLRPRESYETRFYAALDRTLKREFQNVAGRRVVVVLTDGEDSPILYGDTKDFRAAAGSSRSERIPVYIVGLETGVDLQSASANLRKALTEIHTNMQTIADSSGGRLLMSTSMEDVVRLYEGIGSALGTSYSIGYLPNSKSKNSPSHKIEVRTRAAGVRLTQSRDAYSTRP